MKIKKDRFGILFLFLIISLPLFLTCEKQSNPLKSDETDLNGNIVKGHVTYEGGTDFGGITVTLETMNELGQTASVAYQLLKQEDNSDRGLLKSEQGLAKALHDSTKKYETITQPDGYFCFENIPPGQYSLSVKKSNLHYAYIDNIHVSAEGPVVINPVLTPTGSIKGVVRMDGINDFSGTMAYLGGTSYLSFTDNNGVFLISDVPLGDYIISIAAPNYQVIERSVSLTEAGVTVAVDTILIQKYGWVSGRVVSYITKKSLSNVTVNSFSGGSTLTSSDGLFSLMVPAGSVGLMFEKSGYSIKTVYVDNIISGENSNIQNDIELFKGPTTSGSTSGDEYWTKDMGEIIITDDVQIRTVDVLNISSGVIVKSDIIPSPELIVKGELSILGTEKEKVIFYGVSIRIDSDIESSIVHCNIQYCSGTGINIGDGAGSNSDATIGFCNISENYIGIFITGNSDGRIYNSTIEKNLTDGIRAYSSAGANIENCLIATNIDHQLYFASGADVISSNNIIVGETKGFTPDKSDQVGYYVSGYVSPINYNVIITVFDGANVINSTNTISGYYKIVVEDGTYSIKAEASGYNAVTKTINVDGENVKNVNFILQPTA
ncbi:right-handed parallel beta-helix repeat-containing protein [bacterium]|nr:right-handed parallel beta-helix repeat-containing protein [bacterium]